MRRGSGFQLYCDHKNLIYLFDSTGVAYDGSKQSADRIERWQVVMQGFKYTIYHIDGDKNIVADLMTRWGVPKASGAAMSSTGMQTRSATQAQRAAQDATTTTAAAPQQPAADGGAGGPPRKRKRTRARVPIVDDSDDDDHDSGDDITTTSDDGVVRACVTRPGMPARTEPQRTREEMRADDEAVKAELLRFAVSDHPTDDEIKREQQRIPKDRDTLRLREGRGGMLIDIFNKVYVPDSRHLRLRLFIAAHQGCGGHRAHDVTSGWLKQRYTWPGLKRDVDLMCTVQELPALRAHQGRQGCPTTLDANPAS